VVTAADCADDDVNLGAISDDADCDGWTSVIDCDDGDASLNHSDEDGDGVSTCAVGNADCDDFDASSTTVSIDGDCDATVTADDCDDADATSTIVADDSDCDGTVTTDDCDDADPSSTIIADDGDCDGVVTGADCDDADTGMGAISDDGDCDGNLAADDCDDADATSTVVVDDADCDGVVTADDCDDADPTLLALVDDRDCDGAPYAVDCDDADTTLGSIANDADCDGLVTADDCNDSDAYYNEDDADGDGVSTCGGDCDDSDASTGDAAADADCDGTVTSADCDDHDAGSTVVADDADCDGVVTADDCDDTTESLGATSNDHDCDGHLYADDCDDSDSALGDVADDGDCDGIPTAADCDDADPTLGDSGLDADCDGWVVGTDCDDADSASTTIHTDADCDGLVTEEDCDDSDWAPDWGVADDGDCDGVWTLDDCDDADPDLGSVGMDFDCDGWVYGADCDDGDATLNGDDADADGTSSCGGDCDDFDATSTTTATDADCDTVVGALDCDDYDATSTTRPEDHDCDGTITAEDCDDTDATSTVIAWDADCDGTITPADCDDTDASSTLVAYDGDCDGIVTPLDCDDADATSTAIADDADCDGTITIEDCDVEIAAYNYADVDGDGYTTCGDSCVDRFTEWCELAYYGYSPCVYADYLADADYFASLPPISYEFEGCGSTGGGWSPYGWEPGPSGADDCDDFDALVHPGADDDLFEDLNCDGDVEASLAMVDPIFSGEEVWGQLGFSISSAGDVDGDGLPDFIVGAPYSRDVGTAYLLLGKDEASWATGSILDAAAYTFVGRSTEYLGRFGDRVSSAGDVDGDGLDDIVVTAENSDHYDTDAGMIYVFLGATITAAPAGTEFTPDDAEYALTAESSEVDVTSAGDVDGDGLDDLLVGAPTYHWLGWWGLKYGSAYLITGSDLATLGASFHWSVFGPAALATWATTEMVGDVSYGDMGSAVAGVGDIDGDGLDDIAVGASGDDSGRLYVIMGSTLSGASSLTPSSDADLTFYGSVLGDGLGAALAGAGDVDGDGIGDILVGAPNAWGYDGDAYLLSGADMRAYLLFGGSCFWGSCTILADASVTLEGRSTNGLFGSSVSSAGDVDGDGLADILVGARLVDGPTGFSDGAAYVFLGASMSGSGAGDTYRDDQADLTYLGASTGGYAGQAVAGVGDVDGDGKDDFVIGASDSGEVFFLRSEL
jgi:hypothetical protein